MTTETKPKVEPLTEDRLGVALENMRRIAKALCVYCGKDYDEHDPSPVCADLKCDHCHQSDFQGAEPDDPTLLDKDDFAIVLATIDAYRAELEEARRKLAGSEKMLGVQTFLTGAALQSMMTPDSDHVARLQREKEERDEALDEARRGLDGIRREIKHRNCPSPDALHADGDCDCVLLDSIDSVARETLAAIKGGR